MRVSAGRPATAVNPRVVIGFPRAALLERSHKKYRHWDIAYGDVEMKHARHGFTVLILLSIMYYVRHPAFDFLRANTASSISLLVLAVIAGIFLIHRKD